MIDYTERKETSQDVFSFLFIFVLHKTNFVSIFSMQFLMKYIKGKDFKGFGVYRIILGIFVLLYFLFQ